MWLFAGFCLWAISSSSLLPFTPSSLILFLPPDGDSLSQPTHFRDVFFTAEAKIFLSPIALHLEIGGGSRFCVWFGIFFNNK